jgi:hypothetical protein
MMSMQQDFLKVTPLQTLRPATDLQSHWVPLTQLLESP